MKRSSDCLYATQFDEYLRANFEGHGSTMIAQLGPEWFDPGWEWYLGVERGGASESALLELIEHSPEWYWVFASAERVEHFFHIRQNGLKREIVDTTVPDLPSRQYWTYYKISQDEYESPAWAEIRRTQSIAMRVRNFEDLNGARHLDVALPDANRARLPIRTLCHSKLDHDPAIRRRRRPHHDPRFFVDATNRWRRGRLAS